MKSPKFRLNEGAPPWIGRSVERLEDPPLVRGEGSFAADVSFPHQLHMRVVRAQTAHGVIRPRPFLRLLERQPLPSWAGARCKCRAR